MLSDLAVHGRVSGSTRNQAFAALLFLYPKVLQVEPGRVEGVIRAVRPKRLPVGLTRAEVPTLLAGGPAKGTWGRGVVEVVERGGAAR